MIVHDISITPAQRWLFNYFDPPYEWYDRLTFQVQGSFSREKVEDVLRQLIARHDGLRTTFFFEASSWKQRVHPPVKKVDDYLQFSERLSEEQELSLCRAFDIERLPLFKVVITERSQQGFCVIVLFHHIIVDYISVVIFFKEFCTLLKGGVLDKHYSTNLQYIKRLAEAVKPDTESLFWEQQQVQGQSVARKPCLEKYAQYKKKKIEPEKTDKLLRYGKRAFSTSSLSEVVIAPLYKALADRLQTDRVVVSHKLHGREILGSGPTFFSAIGNFAINVPIACVIRSSDRWADLVGQLRNTLNQMPMKGLGYDILAPGLYPDHTLTNVRVNYMGNFSLPIPEGILIDPFTFAKRVIHPQQPLTTSTEFFIYFSKKELIVETCFDPSVISESDMEKFMEKYLQSLDQLLAEV